MGRAASRRPRGRDRRADRHPLVEALRYLEEVLGETDEGRRALQTRAYRWAWAAGDRTAALWQRAEAVHWYREALTLSEAVGATTADRASLARRLTAVGLATESAGGNADAARLALDLYTTLGDEPNAGWAQAQLSFALFRQGKDEEARTEALAAIGAARTARRERGARRCAPDAFAIPDSGPRPRRGGGAHRQARARYGRARGCARGGRRRDTDAGDDAVAAGPHRGGGRDGSRKRTGWRSRWAT